MNVRQIRQGRAGARGCERAWGAEPFARLAQVVGWARLVLFTAGPLSIEPSIPAGGPAGIASSTAVR